MALRYSVRVTGFAVPFTLTIALATFAQSQLGVPIYDRHAEITVTGSIVEVRELSTMGGATQGEDRYRKISMVGIAGVLVLLKTDEETCDLYLGPASYLREQRVELTSDDMIRVIGVRISIGDAKLILVRELRKGNQSWFLRDAQGRPWWGAPSS